MNPDERLQNPYLPVPKGWYRLCLGARIEAGDQLTYCSSNTDDLEYWRPVTSFSVGGTVKSYTCAIIRQERVLVKKDPNEGLFMPMMAVPSGWRRVRIREKIEADDMLTHHASGTESLGVWTRVMNGVVGNEVHAGNTAIIRKVETQTDGIPEGWYRLPLWTVLEEGDRFQHFHERDPRPRRAEDWYPVLSDEFEKKNTVVPGGAACIRKIKNQAETNDAVVSVTVTKNETKEEKTMSKINITTLTALLTLRAGEPTETLPGVEGEGVFAQALKDAELKRRETALKALTEVAIEIQDAFAAAKEAQRAEIRRAQAAIEKAKTRLNILDAAAEPLKSANPNPFPVLNELGMVNRHDLGLSVDEFVKLVAVPGAKN